jgi:hypothetical protein
MLDHYWVDESSNIHKAEGIKTIVRAHHVKTRNIVEFEILFMLSSMYEYVETNVNYEFYLFGKRRVLSI